MKVLACAFLMTWCACGDSKNTGGGTDTHVDVSDADTTAHDSADSVATDSGDSAVPDTADTAAPDSGDSAVPDSADSAATDSADSAATDTADSAATDTADSAATDSAATDADGASPDAADAADVTSSDAANDVDDASADITPDPCTPAPGTNLAAGAPCDPLDSHCAGACRKTQFQFHCTFECEDTHASDGDEGAACDVDHLCGAGLECVSGDNLAGCDSGACCSPYCDLDEPVCSGGAECMPFPFSDLPEHQDVGLCFGDPDACLPVAGPNQPEGTPCNPLDDTCATGACRIADDADVSCDFRCSPIAGAGIAEGEACDAIDTCAPGLLCASGDTVQGCTSDACCTRFCALDAPSCVSGAHCEPLYDPEFAQVPAGYEDVGLCSGTGSPALDCTVQTGSDLGLGTPCDPVAQHCAGGLGCFFASNPATQCDWQCIQRFGPGIAEGRSCQFTNDCLPGLGCVQARYVEGCTGTACCTSFCDVDDAQCPANKECQSWYYGNVAEPGYDYVGTCLPSEEVHCAPAHGTNLGDQVVCDPLAQACGPGLGCYRTLDDGISCDFRCQASADDRAAGSPCSLLNDCDAGLACVQKQYAGECDDDHCCVSYCDLDAPSCPAGTTCTSWYLTTEPSPYFDNVGDCIVAPNPPLVTKLLADHTKLLVEEKVTLTVRLDQAAPAGGLTVAIDTSGVDVTVPSQIVVPAGKARFDFELSAGDVTGSVTVHVSGGGGQASLDFAVRAPGSLGLVLAEVLYNPAGADGGQEWVKLYNGSAAPIALAGYSLSWRGVSFTNGGGTLQLSGTVAAGACFIVGGPTANSGITTYDQVADFEPDIQNGGTAASDALDGVSLYDQAAGGVTVTTVPIDVVAWGMVNTNHILGPDGELTSANAPVVNGKSVRRKDLATWEEADPSAECVVVTE